MYSEKEITLTNKSYEGNMVIVSDKSVLVRSDCKMKDIIVYAPEVEIEAGFKGNLQVFSTGSITVGENVVLAYPSVIGSIIPNNGNVATVTINPGAEIYGAVFAYQEKMNKKNPLILSIENGAVVKGSVYANGTVQLKGSVYGNLTCDKFSLKTRSGVYDNHLLNATIDQSRLSKHYIGINLVGKFDNRSFLKWLY